MTRKIATDINVYLFFRTDIITIESTHFLSSGQSITINNECRFHEKKKVLRRLSCVAVGWKKQSDLVVYEENIIVQQPLNTTFKMSLLCAIKTDHIAKRRQNDIELKD